MKYVPGTSIEKPVVQLSGEDGNAIAIVQRVIRALKKAGVPSSVTEEFRKEALSGDYQHVLDTAEEFAEVS